MTELARPSLPMAVSRCVGVVFVVVVVVVVVVVFVVVVTMQSTDDLGERRPITFDMDDFVKLLHDFNAVGIHFS